MMFVSNQPLTTWVLLQKQPKIVRKKYFSKLYSWLWVVTNQKHCIAKALITIVLFIFFTIITIILN